MSMGIGKNLFQMRHFWTSIIFGPERKIPEIREDPHFKKKVEVIILWLSKNFGIPTKEWKLLRAAKNPNSEVFFFSQRSTIDIPKRIFVKKYVVQYEERDMLDSNSLVEELVALERVSEFNGRYDVTFLGGGYGRRKEMASERQR